MLSRQGGGSLGSKSVDKVKMRDVTVGGYYTKFDLLIQLLSCDTRVNALNNLLGDNDRVNMLWKIERECESTMTIILIHQQNAQPTFRSSPLHNFSIRSVILSKCTDSRRPSRFNTNIVPVISWIEKKCCVVVDAHDP